MEKKKKKWKSELLTKKRPPSCLKLVSVSVVELRFGSPQRVSNTDKGLKKKTKEKTKERKGESLLNGWCCFPLLRWCGARCPSWVLLPSPLFLWVVMLYALLLFGGG